MKDKMKSLEATLFMVEVALAYSMVKRFITETPKKLVPGSEITDDLFIAVADLAKEYKFIEFSKELDALFDEALEAQDNQ